MAAEEFRFGDCELHLASRELLRGGAIQEIQPRAFDVLAYLVRHSDRLVGKDELLDRVWGHRAVSESALTRTVMKVRKAIGDDAHTPRFIVTQHSHGYRFIGTVEPTAPFAAPNASQSVTALLRLPAADDAANEVAREIAKHDRSGLPRHRWVAWWRWWMGGIALALLVAMGVGAWAWLRPSATASASRQRLAVLPVVNATGDPSMDWSRLGLMSLLGDSTGKAGRAVLVPVAETLGALKVVGAGEASDPATAAQVRQIGNILKAGTVVQARLQKDGGHYVLQVGLFQTAGKKIIRTFSGDNPVTVASEAGHEIGRYLSSSMPALPSGRLGKLSLDPYVDETYARALDAKAHGHFKAASRLFGVVMQAVQDQPDRARLQPMLQLAETLEKSGDHRQAMKLAGDARDIASKQHDPSGLARAYQVLSAATENLGDLDTAGVYARKELALASPKHPAIAPAAQMQLGKLAFRRSRYDEAERHVRDAIVDYQRIGSDFHLAGGYLELGEIEKNQDVAAAMLYDKRSLDLARSSGRTDVETSALIDLATVQETLGNCRQSMQYLDNAQSLARSIGNRRLETYVHIGRADCLAVQGHVGKALGELQTARNLAKSLNEPGLEATTTLKYANALSQGKTDSREKTEKLYTQAADMFEQAGQLGQASGSLLNAAQQMTHAGQYAAAAKTLDRSETLARKTQDADLVADNMVARAELEYGQDHEQKALGLLQKARAQSTQFSRTWVNISASVIWLQLDFHQTAKAAAIYAQTVGIGKSYATLCIVSARLLYAQRHFAAALKKQQACLALLGSRVSAIDRGIRDAYRDAAKSGKYVALPEKPPPMLWL